MNGTPERRARILGDEDIEAIRTQFQSPQHSGEGNKNESGQL